MNEKKDTVSQAMQTINRFEALIYQRNQAYAFIAMQGLALDFLKFIENKQCERTTDEELKALIKIYTPKKKHTKK